MSLAGFAIVTFLHDLFTAIWIGGLIVLSVTVFPSMKEVLGSNPQTKKLAATIQKRQSVLVYVSIVGLIVTGILMARRDPSFLGLFQVGNNYAMALTVKHVLVLAMIAIALLRSLVLSRGPATPSREKLNARLLLANVVLGVAVLLASGFTAALAGGA
jgi:putative copper export protein